MRNIQSSGLGPVCDKSLFFSKRKQLFDNMAVKELFPFFAFYFK